MPPKASCDTWQAYSQLLVHPCSSGERHATPLIYKQTAACPDDGLTGIHQHLASISTQPHTSVLTHTISCGSNGQDDAASGKQARTAVGPHHFAVGGSSSALGSLALDHGGLAPAERLALHSMTQLGSCPGAHGPAAALEHAKQCPASPQ